MDNTLKEEITEIVYETCDTDNCIKRDDISDNPECVLVCPTVNELHNLFTQTYREMLPGKRENEFKDSSQYWNAYRQGMIKRIEEVEK